VISADVETAPLAAQHDRSTTFHATAELPRSHKVKSVTPPRYYRLRSSGSTENRRTQWRGWLGVSVSFIVLWHIDSNPSTWSESRNGSQSSRIAITEALEPDSTPARPAGRLDSRFEPAVPCPVGRPVGATVFDVLGRDVRSLVLAFYDRQTWGDAKSAGDYINRIFSAVPEGGAPQPTVYWAESPPILISGTLAFGTGPPRRVLIGKGYIHFEDDSGCQWWGRYLGPDKSKWVVPD